MSGDYDDLRDALQSISEQLGDRIMVLLRDAIDNGATSRPPEEKILARARSAVDRAIGQLDRLQP